MFKPFDLSDFDGIPSFNSAVTLGPFGVAEALNVSFFQMPETNLVVESIASFTEMPSDVNLSAMVASAWAQTAAAHHTHSHRRYSDGSFEEHQCAGCKSEYVETFEALEEAIANGDVDNNVDALIDYLMAQTGDNADVRAGIKDALDTMLFAASTGDAETVSMNGPDIAGDSSTTATIEVGQLLSGFTDASGDQDWYAVELQEGVTYTILQTVDMGVPHNDPLLRLLDSDGNVLAENDDVNRIVEPGGTIQEPAPQLFSGRNSLIEFTATEDGTYYVSAQGWVAPNTADSGVGNYALFIGEGTDRPDFSYEQQALFITDGFSGRSEWQSTTVSYFFDDIPAEAEALYLTAMQAWESVSNIRFVEGDLATANIRYTDEDDDPDSDSAFAASTTGADGFFTGQTNVNVDENWTGSTAASSYELNTYRYQTYLHEIGHALGLGHAGPYNGNAVYGRHNFNGIDSWNVTLMSYFDQGESGFGTARFALAPQIADIIAIHDLYGTPTNSNLGDTVYGFNSTETDVFDFQQWVDAGIRIPSLSVFDSGGTDTIDLSGFEAGQRLDLNAGTFSDVGDNYVVRLDTVPLINSLSIAPGAEIENAVGGSGNDTLIGNALDNVLDGSAGNDTLYGNDGNDVLSGDAGDDMVIADIVRGLSGTEGELFRAYQAVFDRDPDAGGFEAFFNQMRVGNLTQEDVIGQFVDSTEFQITYGTLTNRAFMEQLYQNVLNRPGDTEGLDAFTATLDGGRSRASVVTEFANSAEFITLMALPSAAFATNVVVTPAESNVFRLYQAAFDRAPDVAGFNAFSNAIEGGALTSLQVVEQFIASAEFNLTYGDVTNLEFMTLLYNNVLDRAPDQEGFDAFTGALDGGVRTRAEVVLEFAQSGEFYNNTVDAVADFVLVANSFASDTIINGAGNDTYFGGAGSDRFVFDGNTAGEDVTTILDFTIGVDDIAITGNSGIDSFADVMAAATQDGADTLIDLGSDSQLRLSNVDMTTLTAGDFDFDAATAAKPLEDFSDLSAQLVTEDRYLVQVDGETDGEEAYEMSVDAYWDGFFA